MDTASKGSWTRRIIPSISIWPQKEHGEVDFYRTRLLSGHGCYRGYPHRFGITRDPTCLYCREENDDVEHTFSIAQDGEKKDSCVITVGTRKILTPETLIAIMLKNESIWSSIAASARQVLNILIQKRNEMPALEELDRGNM